MNNGKRRRLALKLAVSGLALYGAAGATLAVDIDTGNPDVSMQWGNTLRYNLGFRAESRNAGWETSGIASTQAKYDKGDVVINRGDWLSELDFSYKGQFGFRLATAAWYNAEFDKQVTLAPGQVASNYNGNVFSNHTKRFHGGPSAEILDAYVFANFDVAGMPANVKVGRQTNLWGEATVLSAHSISNQQQPVDGLKAVSSPGIDAKEVQLPIGQIHGTIQVNDKLSLAAMYQYEWLPTRIAESGTFLSGSDSLLRGPDRGFGGRTNLRLAKPKDDNDWGVSARYNSEWVGGVVGVYFREYTEKGPTISLAPTNYRAIFPESTKLYGLSVGKLIGGLSTAAELSYRKDAALKSTILDGSAVGARGNTWHALANVAKQWGQSAYWSQINLSGELAYSHLDKVTSGAAYFRPCAAGADVKRTGCSSKNNWEATVRLSPTWTAVVPGWDLGATTSLTYGLDGNGSTTGSASENAGSWTVGATATYNNQHDFSIAYNDAMSPVGPQPDRGWLSMTYKYQF
ncbi:DUF1302 domain-containing protein [Noviherbaspirillum sedimenti]|nr:DUF1302 family protein [Noviherbaspirillum sedimenti]